MFLVAEDRRFWADRSPNRLFTVSGSALGTRQHFFATTLVTEALLALKSPCLPSYSFRAHLSARLKSTEGRRQRMASKTNAPATS